jgi:hypothetical protein
MLGGILAIPEGYKPNELSMSDGFKIANHSLTSPVANRGMMSSYVSNKLN